MTLYRFPKVQIDPVFLEFNNIKHKVIDTIQELAILKKILDPNGLEKDIQDFLQNILFFYNEGIYFDNSRKKGTAEFHSEIVLTILIKLRLIDIMFIISDLASLISQFKNQNIMSELETANIINIENQIKLLQDFAQFKEPSQVQPNLLYEVKNIISVYENLPNVSQIINLMKQALDLTPNQIKLLYTGENPLGLNYSFYKIETFNKITFGRFNYSGSCQELKFSNKLYANLYDVLNKIERIIVSISTRGNKNLYEKLHKMNYFTITNNLYQSFFSSDIGEEVYNILQPQNVTSLEQTPTSDEACNNWWINIDALLTSSLVKHQQILLEKYPTITNLISNPIYKLPISGGGNTKISNLLQKGGDVNIVQIYNLSDLLRLICGTAAQFIESFIFEKFQGQQIPNIDILIKELINNYDMCKETMEIILFILADGLMTIQNQQNEGYDYQPTSTEFELLFCLSYIYSIPDTSNVIDNLYINANSQFYNVFIQALQGTTNGAGSSTGREFGLNITRLHDIGYVFQTSVIATESNSTVIIPAEILNLLILTLIDNTMQNINNISQPKQGYFFTILTTNGIPSVGFDSVSSWSKLMDYFYAYLYIFSTTSDKQTKFAYALSQIRNLSGGKKNKTNKRQKSQTRQTRRKK